MFVMILSHFIALTPPTVSGQCKRNCAEEIKMRKYLHLDSTKTLCMKEGTFAFFFKFSAFANYFEPSKMIYKSKENNSNNESGIRLCVINRA